MVPFRWWRQSNCDRENAPEVVQIPRGLGCPEMTPSDGSPVGVRL